jgi:hypothetical protein
LLFKDPYSEETFYYFYSKLKTFSSASPMSSQPLFQACLWESPADWCARQKAKEDTKRQCKRAINEKLVVKLAAGFAIRFSQG